jgi:hypothetical protein
MLALMTGVLASDTPSRHQDPLLDREKYAAACPDYRTYSMHGQYVTGL